MENKLDYGGWNNVFRATSINSPNDFSHFQQKPWSEKKAAQSHRFSVKANRFGCEHLHSALALENPQICFLRWWWPFDTQLTNPFSFNANNHVDINWEFGRCDEATSKWLKQSENRMFSRRWQLCYGAIDTCIGWQMNSLNSPERPSLKSWMEIGWFIRYEIKEHEKQNGKLTFQTHRLQCSIETKTNRSNAKITSNIDTHDKSNEWCVRQK